MRFFSGGDFQTYSLFPHRRDVTSLSLLYGYFYDKPSGEFHSLIPPIQTCYIHRVEYTSAYSICKKEAPASSLERLL